MIGRNEILLRFEEWLDAALAREEPPQGIPPEILNGEDSGVASAPIDLYTMWAAITALTQEVKLQGRSFKQLSDTLAREAEHRNEQQLVDALIEIRERLLRGFRSAADGEEPRPTILDHIFRSRWRAAQHTFEVARALKDGYRLTLEYVDDLLAQRNVRPIDLDGASFDARRMNAVDVKETDEAPEGAVLSVYRTGYEWNGEVYRTAQVRVAKPRPSGRA